MIQQMGRLLNAVTASMETLAVFISACVLGGFLGLACLGLLSLGDALPGCTP